MIKVQHLSKEIKGKIILKDLSFVLPDNGLIAIYGKSGCGKTTLVNILANLDKDYTGDIIFNNYKYQDYPYEISKNIGVIYQNYNLLNNYTVFDNIKISALINDNFDENKIIALCKNFNLDKKILHKKCRYLSGGEKQRIAIMRVLINEPCIILADEPTGSLDSKNSKIVMELLKKASQTSLVILVTHNLELAKIYCDNILEFSALNKQNLITTKKEINLINKRKKDKSFLSLIKCHMATNKIRHILASITLIFSYTFTSLCLTFVSEVRNIDGFSANFADRSVFTISKSKKEKIENSVFSYTQLSRPTISEILSLKNILPDFTYYYDLSVFYPRIVNIVIDEQTIENVLFLPCFENLGQNEIKINNSLSKLINTSIINVKLETYFQYKAENFSFKRNLSLKIVNVINEISLMNSPKIYYNYYWAYDDLNKNALESYQKTYLQIIKDANGNDPLSNYQMIINIKNYQNIPKMYEIINKGITNYEISSNAHSIESTINELVKAFLLVLLLFEIITLVSSFAIILYITLSIIFDYQKEKVILISLGKNKNSFFILYFTEIFILFVFAFVMSLLALLPANKALQSISNRFFLPLKCNLFWPIIISFLLYALLIFVITFIANEKLKKENLINLLRNE